MTNNIKPIGTYTSACYIHYEQVNVGGDIKASGQRDYLECIEIAYGIVKRGGMQRRSTQLTLEKLKIMGVIS